MQKQGTEQFPEVMSKAPILTNRPTLQQALSKENYTMATPSENRGRQ